MKAFFILLTMALAIPRAHGQTTQEDSVRSAVNQLFIAMRTADPVLLKGAFADSGRLQTIIHTKDGKIKAQDNDIDEFAQFVGGEAKGNVDEQITMETIKIDGDLAMVWAPYQFFYKGKFSHCGVDCMELVRFNGTWKIQYLIDTRRVTGCQ